VYALGLLTKISVNIMVQSLGLRIRRVKIDRFRLQIWTYSYRSNNWVGQSMSPKKCGLINHPEKVSSKFWVLVLKVKAGIVRCTTPTHMVASPIRSHNPNQAVTHCLKRVLLQCRVAKVSTDLSRHYSSWAVWLCEHW